MTTPNYPYGEPGNNNPGNDDGTNQNNTDATPGYGSYGGDQVDSAGGAYPSEPTGAGQFSASYPTAGGDGYQDPYNSGYSGGFENSPMNITKNKTAAWALGLGIASVVSLLLMLIPVVGLIGLLAPFIAVAGIIVAIVALVKGKKYQGSNKRTGWSIAGLVLSILTLAIIAVVIIGAVVFFSNSGIIDCVADNTDPAAQQACIEHSINQNFQ
ncbi:MAG: DUF4190 domain-containing protein [Corynebacterium sp.]|nr:DUF4190 domain-containing protein [Corynebacterium sp.]